MPLTPVIVHASVAGDVGGFLRSFARDCPAEMSRVIRHAAYQAHLRLKAELIAGAPGGHRLPDITPVQKRRALEDLRHKVYRGRWRGAVWKYERDAAGRLVRRNAAPRGPYGYAGRGLAYGMNGGDWPLGGRLAQMLRYEHRKGSLTALVGWFNKSGKNHARTAFLWQKGQRTVVTPKMRRLFALAGHPLSRNKTVIAQPERPAVSLFAQGRRQWLGAVMFSRARNLLNGLAARKARQFQNAAAKAARRAV